MLSVMFILRLSIWIDVLIINSNCQLNIFKCLRCICSFSSSLSLVGHIRREDSGLLGTVLEKELQNLQSPSDVRGTTRKHTQS